MINENIILFIIGILNIPVGILLNKITKSEKEIYTKIFPALLWILAISSAIFLLINKQIAITTIYIFTIIFVWQNLDKIKK